MTLSTPAHEGAPAGGSGPPGDVVVLGVGNLLLTDEGVGPALIARLGQRWAFPPHVELVDGATAGLELINVFGRAAHILVVDTVLGGAEPGAVFLFHPDDVPREVRYRTSIHQISFMDAWNLARLLGPVPEITIVGVQPEDMTTPHVGLSDTLQQRLPQVEQVVLEELARLGVTPKPRATSGEAGGV